MVMKYTIQRNLFRFTEITSRAPRQCHVAKRYNKNLFFKSALLTPTVSTSAFHSTNLFLFSRHHIPTDNVAPFSAYKPTNNP